MVGGRKVGEGNRGTSPTVDPLEPFFLIGLTLCLHLEVPRAIKAVPNPTLSRGITMLRMVLPIDTIYQSYFWKSFFFILLLLQVGKEHHPLDHTHCQVNLQLH